MKKLFTCQGRPLGLIILAGGYSRRMKSHKAMLPVPGGVLIERTLDQLREHFAQVIVSVSDRRRFEFLPDCDMVEDPVQGQGPMRGLHTALPESRHEKNFVIACDIPVIRMNFLADLISAASSYEIAVPVKRQGQLEPLFAVYSQKVRPVMGKLLDSGERSLLPLFALCRTRRVFLDDSWMVNLNTRSDYKNFLKQNASKVSWGKNGKKQGMVNKSRGGER